MLQTPAYTLRLDTAFEEVIAACAQTSRPPDRAGPGLPEEIQRAYCELHGAGYARSAEAWLEGRLAGGLYGVSLVRRNALAQTPIPRRAEDRRAGADPPRTPVALISRRREVAIGAEGS
jgi:hypothetical protein